MPGKPVKQITTPTENTVSEPVQEVAPVTATPVAQKTKKNAKTSAPQEATPVSQKGGKKNVVAESVVESVAPSTAVESAPTPVLTTAESVAPVVVAPKKGGGRKTKAVVESASVPVETASSTEGVSPSPKKRAVKVAKSSEPVTENSEQKGGKPKVAKKVKAVKAVTATEPSELEDSSDRRVRSFKVKLPDKEEFEGRFTGLTPYQAANKALSKYFRETENPKVEITFLICESTRKSKKSVYTYIGKRYQLEVPVKYTIQDGREIVKNFKNSLKKVKKVDLSEQAGGAATVVAPATA